MSDIKEILSKYKTIAMVGVSNNPAKASTIVMEYMQKYGFKVYPVNPKAKGQKILGEEVYERITEIKDGVDIVDVFRPSNEVLGIANDTVKIKVPPNTKVLYWAAKKLDSDHHIVWKAYDDYSNSGVVMSDNKGIATLKLLKGSGYIVPWGKGKYIPPHVHYRYELSPGKFGRLETVYY